MNHRIAAQYLLSQRIAKLSSSRFLQILQNFRLKWPGSDQQWATGFWNKGRAIWNILFMAWLATRIKIDSKFNYFKHGSDFWKRLWRFALLLHSLITHWWLHAAWPRYRGGIWDTNCPPPHLQPDPSFGIRVKPQASTNCVINICSSKQIETSHTTPEVVHARVC